jgi:hypothetical protein
MIRPNVTRLEVTRPSVIRPSVISLDGERLFSYPE